MKRGNGRGSVYKRKGQNLRSPWVAVITLGYTMEGKPIRKHVGSFRTAKEANQALDAFLASPTDYANSKRTFGQCFDHYIDIANKRGVTVNSTWKKLKDALAPLWREPMENIRTAHLQVIIDELGGAARTQQARKIILTSVFKLAIQEDVILKNYASYIITDKVVQSDKHFIFSNEELRTLWSHSSDPAVQIVLVYTYTGTRVSELTTMSISNVHLQEGYMVGGVKTEAGRGRIIPIANCIRPFVANLLAKAQFRQSSTLIGTSEKYMRDVFKDTCKKLGLRDHSSHDARHTFITMAVNNGIDDVKLKQIIGHKQSGVTAQVYIHNTIPLLIDAVNRLPYGDQMEMFGDMAVAKM